MNVIQNPKIDEAILHLKQKVHLSVFICKETQEDSEYVSNKIFLEKYIDALVKLELYRDFNITGL